MDGKSNAIRGRISSVKNTKKITEAMRLVAAAKVRLFGCIYGPRAWRRHCMKESSPGFANSIPLILTLHTHATSQNT